MSTSEPRVLVGQIVEDEVTLTLDELSGACAVERERIVELVDLGVLDLQDQGGHFAGPALRRARLALRLQRDLGIDAAGAALAVELLERIEMLEAQLR